MNVRQRKRVLWSAAAALCLAGAAVIAWGVATTATVTPREQAIDAPAVAGRDQPTDSPNAPAGPANARERPSLEALNRLASLKLRQPLFEQASTDQRQTATEEENDDEPRRSLSLRLVGTIQEPGHSMALFRKSNGTFELCPQGQSIEDGSGQVTVTRVGRRTVTVQFAGRSRELTMPDEESRGR